MAPTHPDLSRYSSAEIDAIEALMKLSRRPVVFSPQLPPPRDPDETDTDSDLSQHERNEAAQFLVSMKASNEETGTHELTTTDTETGPAGEDESLSPPANILSNINSGKPFFHDLLQCQPLNDFIKHGLRAATIEGGAEERVSMVLDAMTERHSVQEGCWYLEECDWRVAEAIERYRKDESVRKFRFKSLYDSACTLANPVTEQNYTTYLLRFECETDDGTFRVIATFTHAEKRFDISNYAHRNALNQWHCDLTRLIDGPWSIENFPATNTPYSAAEKRVLRNLFARQLEDLRRGERPDMEGITHDFNTLFAGRFLPGRYSPCGVRTTESIRAVLGRERRETCSPPRRNINTTAAVRWQMQQERDNAAFASLLRASDMDEDVDENDKGEDVNGSDNEDDNVDDSDNGNDDADEVAEEKENDLASENDIDAEMEIPDSQEHVIPDSATGDDVLMDLA